MYDFETILAPLNEHPTDDLTYLSRHTPIRVAIHHILSKDPVYLVNENPERLTERFIKILTEKQEAIVSDVWKRHSYPSNFEMLLDKVKNNGSNGLIRSLVNGLIGFNSSKYDINMVKEYFEKKIRYNKESECNEDVFVAKKENDYMFLITPKFKFLEVKHYIGSDLSYDAWCNSMGCRLQKLMIPYEWLDSYEKLSHVGPVGYKDFYSSFKPTIAKDEYEQFLKMFKANNCTTMGDWLRVYNVVDVVPFIEAFRKMAEQYCLDKVDVCKDAVCIPGISRTYLLNKSLRKDKKLESYSPGGI